MKIKSTDERDCKKTIHHPLEYLLSRLKSIYDEKDQSLVISLRAIYRSELRRYVFIKLTHLVIGDNPSSLDTIIVAYPKTGNMTEITTSKKIQTALLQCNATHVHQAL